MCMLKKLFEARNRRKSVDFFAVILLLLHGVLWLLLVGWFRDTMQKGMGLRDMALPVCSSRFLLDRDVEEGQLNNSWHLLFATRRCVSRGAPVEQPLIGTQINQR